LGANDDAIRVDGLGFSLRSTHPETVVTSPPRLQGLFGGSRRLDP
jgi:hypothetical protein